MRVPLLNLSRQHEQIREALAGRFDSIINTTAFTLGKDVEIFENNFSRYLGIEYVIGVDNGTDALTIAYQSLGLVPGDEIITIPTTFIATVSSAMHLGIKPVFVDIDEETRNFDFTQLEKILTKRTKAIVPVHLYGDVVDMDKVKDFAKTHNLKMIEDASQAHGARYKGIKVGTIGDVSCFSFYPGKNLGAYGQAGAIATNDNLVNQMARKLRNQGEAIKYNHEVLGYNSRLDTLQAAVLDEKLKFLDKWNSERLAIADKYDASFKNIKYIKVPPRMNYSSPVFHLYVVEILEGSREKFLKYLAEKEISAGIHYPFPLHLTPALSSLGYKKGDFPVSEKFCNRIISLPIFPGMNDEEVGYVSQAVKDYFN